MRYTEINPNSTLQDAFHCYRRNNLVRSQKAFSHQILGQQSSYYSCMMTRSRTPSRKVLETLLSVTKTIVSTFIGNPHFGKSYAVNLNAAYDDLDSLIQRLSVELELPIMVENLDQP